MTYSEIQDRLNRVETALTALNSGNYDTLSQDYSQQSISQLQEIQTQLKEQLSLLAEEEDGSVVTDSPEDAEKLAKKGVRVKLTNEQDKAAFDINETKAIAVATGKALQKSLKSLGDEVSRMKATNIEPSSFDVKVEYKNGNEDQFSFYINEDDSLHLVDFSFDKELTDVGVKPSGEAVVNVDVLANALTNHFRSANETTEDMRPKDVEFEKAKEADRLEKHPESETIKAIYDLMQNANSMEEESSLQDVEHKLTTCPVGCIATGGGHGPFRKIGKNTWKGKAGLQHSQSLASLIGGFEDFNIDESHCNSTHEELAELFGNDIFDNRPHGETEFMGVKINKDKEDKEDKKPLKEFTSTGKLTGHEDFKFLAQQLTTLCGKENAKDALRVLMSVGELGLDLGYAEAKGDAEMATSQKSISEGRGDLQTIVGIIEDRAAESGFSVEDEAEEVIEAIQDYYKLNEVEENVDKVAGGIPYRQHGNKVIISEPLDDATKERLIGKAKEHGYFAQPNMAGGITITLKGGMNEVDEDRFVAAAFEDLEQVIRNLAHTANISEDEALEMAINKLEAMLDGRDDLDEGRKDDDALYPDNPRLPEIKNLADKIVSMVKAEAAKGELGYIKTMEEIRYQQEDDFERTPEWNKAKGIRSDFDDYGSGTNETAEINERVPDHKADDVTSKLDPDFIFALSRAAHDKGYTDARDALGQASDYLERELTVGLDESIASVSKQLDKVKADIKTELEIYKTSEGESAKKAAVEALKTLNSKKKDLEKQLDAKVAGKGYNQELN